MSYDLHLFRPPPGTDLRAAGKHSFQYEGDGPPTPQSEARKRGLADALVAHDPRLKVLDTDLETAWTGPPPLELQTMDDSGIRILLFDLTAALELPYARGGATWAQALGYVRVLEEVGGFRTWDPQTEDLLDSGAAAANGGTPGYGRGTAVVQKILRQAEKERRPWWKLW